MFEEFGVLIDSLKSNLNDGATMQNMYRLMHRSVFEETIDINQLIDFLNSAPTSATERCAIDSLQVIRMELDLQQPIDKKQQGISKLGNIVKGLTERNIVKVANAKRFFL